MQGFAQIQASRPPATTFSGPAQRSLTLRPARSRSRQATLYIESSDSFVTSAADSIASGWSEPVPGREFHPLKSSAFHGALYRQLRFKYAHGSDATVPVSPTLHCNPRRAVSDALLRWEDRRTGHLDELGERPAMQRTAAAREPSLLRGSSPLAKKQGPSGRYHCPVPESSRTKLTRELHANPSARGQPRTTDQT